MNGKLKPVSTGILDYDYVLPEMCKPFFYAIGDNDMKRVDLGTFHHFGGILMTLKHLWKNTIDTDSQNAIAVVFASVWTKHFLEDTKDIHFPLCRKIAVELQSKLDELAVIQRSGMDVVRDAKHVGHIKHLVSDFEATFRQESPTISVFAVTKKGLLDIGALVERGEEEFEPETLKWMPPLAIFDVKEAAKCLAFECPTAMAFHLCRALEAVVLRYYQALTSYEWTDPSNPYSNEQNLGKYVLELERLGADLSITTRLNEIRKYDRNALTHPDMKIELAHAVPVFKLVSAVIPFMTTEIEKLETARTVSPTSIP